MTTIKNTTNNTFMPYKWQNKTNKGIRDKIVMFSVLYLDFTESPINCLIFRPKYLTYN